MKKFLYNFFKRFYEFLTFFFLILLCYTYYRSEIVYNGDRLYFYKPYYFLTIFLTLISFIIIFIKPILKKYITIIILSILFSLYLFECYLILDIKRNIKQNYIYEKKNETKKYSNELIKIRAAYKKATGEEYDTRSKLEVFENIKKLNKKVKLLVYPYLYIEDESQNLFPLSGISNSETIYCNENGYYLINWTDRFGFNNPDSEWEKKETKYILIGDSYTQGFCVERPYDLASVLRQNNENKAVINLGYGGT